MRRFGLALLCVFFFTISANAKRIHISDAIEGKPDNSEYRPSNIKNKPSSKAISNNVTNIRAAEKIAEARKSNPSIDRLYTSTQKSAQTIKDKELTDAGTNIALKKIAADFEKQFLKLMWQFAHAGVGEEKFSNDVWKSQWRESIIEAGTEMGDIGWAIYEELARDNIKKGEKRK